MKHYFKKTLAILLVAASFNFLSMFGKATSNILTYADVNTTLTLRPNPIQFGYEVKNGTLFQKVDGLPFYFEDPIKPPSHQRLKTILKNAKDKIYKTLGLKYTGEMKTKIFVCNGLENGKDYDGILLGLFMRGYNEIYINEHALLSESGVLAHEMTHALLCHSLGEHCKDLNLGLNEGFATQNEELGTHGILFKNFIPTKDMCFFKSYDDDNKTGGFGYAFHQYMIHDWIEAQDKDVVKKWLERVKNGEDSVKVFLELGGNKIAQKYNCVDGFKFLKSLKEKLIDLITLPFRFLNRIF